MGLLLLLIAFILLLMLLPVLVLWAVFTEANKNKYFFTVAVSIDQLGNVIGGPFFNQVLILKDSEHRFGNPDETISSVLGKNKASKKLRRSGILLAGALDRIQVKHVEKAIENDEN